MLAVLALAGQAPAQDRARYEKMIAKHAKANLVPEALVHRLIVRESKYNPELIGHGGTIGLMQIKLATAKGVGYSGDADGLRDPETNLTYGVKYLAGAYRAAGGDYDRAIRYFAGGYYYVAKQQRLERLKQGKPDFNAAPPKIAKVEEKPAAPIRGSRACGRCRNVRRYRQTGRRRRQTGGSAAETRARRRQARARRHKPKAAKKKLADAKQGQVPRPPAAIPSGANGAKPR